MGVVQICVILTIILHCNGLSVLDQLAHIQRRSSLPGEPSVILGAPSYPYHLPPAEPILPGHTLIRPSIGMLKSSVKFPHREQENGSGVYGHFENLGIKFDGKNERVLYTGFRRLLPQTKFSQLKSTNKNPSSYRRRHLEIIPPKLKKQQLNSVRKPEDAVLGLAIIIKKVKETDLLDIFRMIRSFRRDQELQPEEKPKKLYVSGTANFGDFGFVESDTESSEVNKTAMFWKTKNAFNHIKISPEAPDHTELIPPDAVEQQNNWWFYHQVHRLPIHRSRAE